MILNHSAIWDLSPKRGVTNQFQNCLIFMSDPSFIDLTWSIFGGGEGVLLKKDVFINSLKLHLSRHLSIEKHKNENNEHF